ncbi:MAG: PBP1A family penicillin-binding protein [Patescibacteria group bacterium]
MARKHKFIWLKIIGALILIFFSASLFVLAKVAKIAKELPDPKQFVASHQVSQSSKIYDRTGEILLYEIYSEEKRTIIPFKKIPDYVKKATIAIEDKNFYEHPALDWRALIRAFLTNVIEGRVVQGGSTITQQLAKNAFLNSEKTYERKIKELILSYWIEKKYSKDEILELYLNQIPYGNNTYGIEAASKTYFGKSAEELSLAESALLASIPKAPTYYSPYSSHKDELIQRKDYTLEQMLSLSFIDNEEFKRTKDYQYKFQPQNIGSIKAPHFVMMVKDYLIEKYGENFLENGGLKIITTLNWDLQQTAELVVKEGAERNENLYKGKNAALVAQDPKTGQILTLVGSRDYFDVKNDGNFNVASQGLRQPGSSFKPFAYLTAFKKGYSLKTIVFDLPTEFTANNPNCPLVVNFSNKSKECYHPENFDRQFRGPVNLKNALAQSLNIPSVKVLYLAGIEDTIKTAKDMGITTLNDISRYGLSLVLGGGEVKLIDLVNAYAVFSQEGIRHNQKIVLKIEDFSGKTIEDASDQAVKIVDSQYIRLITDILSDDEARKPLYQNSFNLTTFEDRQVALKTGTSNDYIDAWTIGYTPYLVVGVWAGNNNNTPMQKQAGSILAALPIWNSFMSKTLNNFPVEFFNDAEKENEDINKTMLNGNYINNNSIHNILYYIDKNNPLGETPLNPENDFQFKNWETPVQNWIKLNSLQQLSQSTTTIISQPTN